MEDTPGHSAVGPLSLVSQLLDTPDPLCLQLIQGLLAGQPNLIHALWVCDAQASALPTRQQQDSYLVQRNLSETWRRGAS
jgi:hypothetical protein